MNGKLNLGSVMCAQKNTQSAEKIRAAMLSDSKLKAYQELKIEIAVSANLKFIKSGNEILMDQCYTQEQQNKLYDLNMLIELQTNAIIRHYS